MLRQVMDAATLANDGNMSGFISERLGLEGEEIQLEIGKMTKIESTVGDFKNSIMMMAFPGPNAALMQLMEVLDARAQRLGATTAATTGTPDAQTVQPTTYLAEIEQAMETFSSVQMRLSNSISEEFQKIYRINQRYLPLVSYYTVNNEPAAITRMDYADDMMVQPIFDPKFATQAQKVTRAQAELQATMSNPNNQGRPQVYDEAYRRYLQALDVDNIDMLIPPPPEPANVDNQLWENSQFLLPPNHRQPLEVFPEHNHALHLAQLEQFVQEYGAMLMSPDQAQLIMLHKQSHEGYLYAEQNGVLKAPSQPAEQSGASLLAAGQDNQMGLGSAPEAVPSTAPMDIGSLLGAAAPQGGAGAGSPPH